MGYDLSMDHIDSLRAINSLYIITIQAIENHCHLPQSFLLLKMIQRLLPVSLDTHHGLLRGQLKQNYQIRNRGKLLIPANNRLRVKPDDTLISRS